MKRLFRTLILIIILFGAIIILTAKIELPFGGDNIFGFPLTFYEMFSNEFRMQKPSAFNFPNFLIDLAIVIVLGSVTERAATVILRKLRKK